MKHRTTLYIVLILAVALLAAGCSEGTVDDRDDTFPGEVPGMISMTSLPMDTIATIGTANMAEYLLTAEGTNIRFVPHATGLSRLAPLRAGSVDMVCDSNAMVYYQWGLEEAADLAWGPQPLRMVALAMRPEGGLGMATNKPDIYKSYEDITPATRIAQVPGMGFWNTYQRIIIAWAGLTLDDMDTVRTYPALADAVRGFRAGEFDIIGLGLTAPAFLQMEGEGDLHFIDNPPSDCVETTTLMFELADPYRTNYRADGYTGPLGISEDNPYPTLGYPNPIIAAYPDSDKNTIYHFTRMVCEHWEEYLDLYPLVLQGYSVENMLSRPYNLPWHEGSVAYFKEIDVWTDELEEINQLLIQLQEEVAELWTQAILDAADEEVPTAEWQQYWINIAEPYVMDFLEEHVYPLWWE